MPISIKGKLYFIAGLVALILVAFTLTNIYTSRQGTQALSRVYERQVEPTTALITAESLLKAVHFRMAAYLLEQTPATGNRNHLQEARVQIPSAWRRFMNNHGVPSNHEERMLIDTVDRNIGVIEPFFDKLEKAYARRDRAVIGAMLEDEWPFAVQATVLKPISKLVLLQEAEVKRMYKDSIGFSQRVTAVLIFFLGMTTLVLMGLITRIIVSITRPLDTAVTVADKVADGDWSGTIDTRGTDEFGKLLCAIDHMRNQVHARQERLETILDNAAEGIITFDERGVIEGFNHAAERLFGYTHDEIAGRDISLLIPPTDPRDKRKDYLEHFMRQEIARLIDHEGEATGRHKDGTRFPMMLKVSKIVLQGRPLYTGLVADISERKSLIEHLKHMAEHDGLTGLYNRTYFMQELERAVQRIKRGSQACAILYIDLDNFKYVNDTLGHAAGDKLLIEIASLLNKRARKSDVVSRLGGDEFTVLLYDVRLDNVSAIADSFRRSLSDYLFVHEKERVTIGCSIGVALLTRDTESAAQALSQADIGCHIAKVGGRNRVHVFSPADQPSIATMALDIGWSQRIKEAIANDFFVLACQPVVDTRTMQIESYEVLIRLRAENGEYILPGGFMPSVERFGLSVDVDKWVIVHAIDALAARRKQEPGLRFCLNLSGPTLSDPTIAGLIIERIKAAALEPSALTLEVTETVAISDMNVAARFLTEMRTLGCRTALDDFGSGLSSFAYLRDLPVDLVKIDGRFVKNITGNPVDQAMVKAMNDIIHTLGKRTVAEWVETEEALQLLVSYGVDYVQGHYFGRPEVLVPCKSIARLPGSALCRM